MYRSRVVLFAVCIAFSSVCFAADRLPFRGPNGSGVTNESITPESYSADENLLWLTVRC